MLHCNDIDDFVMLMGNITCNWVSISRNDIVSKFVSGGIWD